MIGPDGGWRHFWGARGVIPRWQLLLVYVLIVAAGYVGFNQTGAASDKATRAAAESQQVARRADAALCALRHDLEDRVQSSERFLAQHPEGFAGIPAATIRNGLDGQRRTIRALSILKCR